MPNVTVERALELQPGVPGDRLFWGIEFTQADYDLVFPATGQDDARKILFSDLEQESFLSLTPEDQMALVAKFLAAVKAAGPKA